MILSIKKFTKYSPGLIHSCANVCPFLKERETCSLRRCTSLVTSQPTHTYLGKVYMRTTVQVSHRKVKTSVENTRTISSLVVNVTSWVGPAHRWMYACLSCSSYASILYVHIPISETEKSNQAQSQATANSQSKPTSWLNVYRLLPTNNHST